LLDYHKNTIVLWNPSLKKSLILPKSRVLSQNYCKANFGFGFVATRNVYKIICFSYNRYETSQNAAEIYELGTGSWRNLEVDDYSYLDVNF
jgi:F-box interacting protein